MELDNRILKHIRKSKGFTVIEAAEKLEIGIGMLSDLEHERLYPNIEIIYAMQKLYKEYLLDKVRYVGDGRLQCPHCGKPISLD